MPILERKQLKIECAMIARNYARRFLGRLFSLLPDLVAIDGGRKCAQHTDDAVIDRHAKERRRQLGGLE